MYTAGASSHRGGRRGTFNWSREGAVGSLRLGVRVGPACAGLCVAATVSCSAYGQTPDVAGTYWATEYRAKIAIVGGGELPLTAAGKAAYEKNVAGLKDGSVIDVARRYCVPDGLP